LRYRSNGSKKLERIEKKAARQDGDIKLIFKYLKQLLHPPEEPRRRIGFRRDEG
jgi:hypothetical protein